MKLCIDERRGPLVGEETGPIPGHDAEDEPTEGLRACISLKEGTACTGRSSLCLRSLA